MAKDSSFDPAAILGLKQKAAKKPFPKKMALLGVAALAGLLLLACFGWLLYFHSQFGLYQDDEYKFTIRYPKSWKVIIHPRAQVAVIFLRPKDTVLDTIQENFNVTVQPVPNGILTLAAFNGTVKRQMTGVFGKNINIVEDRPLQWGWREGHEIVIEEPRPNQLKMVNAWVLSGGQSYILTFLGDMDKYAQDKPFVKEMIRSLKLQ